MREPIQKSAAWGCLSAFVFVLLSCSGPVVPGQEINLPDPSIPASETRLPTEEIEPTYPQVTAPSTRETRGRPTSVLPTETPTPTFHVSRDMPYARHLEDSGGEHLLDIYSPLGEGSWPIVVFLHGFGASKDLHRTASGEISQSGAVVFVPNWPTWGLSQASAESGRGFREIYEVVSCALQYARVHGPEYGGDPSKVILAGFSAGAGTGSWISLGGNQLHDSWGNYADTHGGPPQQVICYAEGRAGNVNAFVGVAGHYRSIDYLREVDEDLWRLVSPVAYIGRSPDLIVRLLHGEHDELPPFHSATFNDLLLEAGYDSEFIPFDGIHIVPLPLIVDVIQELAKYKNY